MKVFSEESALQLSEMLLQNDKDIKTEIEGKIPSVDGVTPNLTIGTVETLDARSDATATITGDKENPVLNLGIPKGVDGYTPVKGTDYWTNEDISEIQSYIDTQIGGALNGSY